MNNVVPFLPRPERTAEESLVAFIAYARTTLARFGENLDFDAYTWDVTDHAVRTGERHARSRQTLPFTAWTDPKCPMSARTIDFAKAYLRAAPLESLGSVRHALQALRALDAALEELGQSDVVHATAETFNVASSLLFDRYPNSSANGATFNYALRRIAGFLHEYGLAMAPLADWDFVRRHSHSRNRPDRVGAEFDRRRERSLPDPEALAALPKAYRLASDPRDVIVTSAAAILCAAPERINEVLVLATNCEVEQRASDGRNILGLRWAGSKGAEPHIKWMLPGMADVVREALGRIRSLTEQARQVARWYESNSTQLFLPERLQFLRGKEFLDIDEISDVMGLTMTSRNNVYRWVHAAGLPVSNERRDRRNRTVVAFSDLQQHIVSLLPKGFPLSDPRTGLRFSESLFVVPWGTFNRKGSGVAVGSPCMFEAVDYHHIKVGLGSNAKAGSVSVFRRTGLDPDNHLAIHTHQFRHYLNTLAQSGGVSQIDIAKWSGRVNVAQNAAYDHVSSEEIIGKVREAISSIESPAGMVSAEIPGNPPVLRSEFAGLDVSTAHATLYGFCTHDFVETPCEMFRRCLDCRDHVCIKGDPAKADRIRQARVMAEEHLARAKEAVADEVYGADAWLEAHTATVERLTQLLAVIEDDTVPDGAVIQLGASGLLTLTEATLRDRLGPPPSVLPTIEVIHG